MARFDPTPLPPPRPPTDSELFASKRPKPRRPIRIRLFLPLLLVVVSLGAAVGHLLEQHAHDQAALDEAHEEIAAERHMRKRAEEALKKAQSRVAPVAATAPAPPPPTPPPAPAVDEATESAPKARPGADNGALVPKLHLDLH